MGAFAFGYHLAILNGPLQAISADLGFAGKPALEGLVRSGPRPCPAGLCPAARCSLLSACSFNKMYPQISIRPV